MSERLTDEEELADVIAALLELAGTGRGRHAQSLRLAARHLESCATLAARAGDREGEPMVAVDWPGNPSFLYGWVTMWLEVNRRYLPADQCDLLIAQMDRFYDANGRNREIVEWASRAAPGGETRAEG